MALDNRYMEHLSLVAKFLAHQSAIVSVAAFFILWLLVWLPILAPLAVWIKWQPPQPISDQQKLPLVLSLYALAPLILWVWAWAEDMPFASYGLTWRTSTLVSFLLGLGIGGLGVALLFALAGVLGWVTWQFGQFGQLLRVSTIALIIGILVSLIEELVFRGFLLNQFQREFSPWLAAIAVSLIFALLHLVWEGKKTIPQLPGLWLMGMVLTLARWADGGNLGLACGLHAGWIWAIATIDSVQLIRPNEDSPDWLLGYSGKPLAGAIGIFLLFVTAALILGIEGWLSA